MKKQLTLQDRINYYQDMRANQIKIAKRFIKLLEKAGHSEEQIDNYIKDTNIVIDIIEQKIESLQTERPLRPKLRD